MAIQCVDISENKRLDAVSPIATVAFLVLFIILTLLMDLGIFWLIAVMTSWVGTYIFFQYSPRYIILLFKFLFTHAYLVPLFKDEKYIPDHNSIRPLSRIVEGYERNIEEEELG